MLTFNAYNTYFRPILKYNLESICNPSSDFIGLHSYIDKVHRSLNAYFIDLLFTS